MRLNASILNPFAQFDSPELFHYSLFQKKMEGEGSLKQEVNRGSRQTFLCHTRMVYKVGHIQTVSRWIRGGVGDACLGQSYCWNLLAHFKCHVVMVHSWRHSTRYMSSPYKISSILTTLIMARVIGLNRATEENYYTELQNNI